MTDSVVTYNVAEQRYEMPVGGLIVYANVRKDTKTLYIDYVFAPPELRGTGEGAPEIQTV